MTLKNSEPKPCEAAFWGVSGQIIRAIGPHTEADSMALLSQLLTAYGSMIGREAFFSAEADKHRANIFVLNIGNSAKGRKGTSWGQIRRIIERVDEKWLKESITNGVGSGEGLIWLLSKDDDPLSGKIRSYTKVLTIMESEFGSLLKVVNKEGNTTSPILRNAWDGITLRNVTKGSNLEVSDHHISAIGHITKTELLHLLKQTEVMNGLANRFIFFFVKRSKYLPHGGDLPEEEINMMAAELKSAISFGRMPRQMKRSNEANALWEKVYPRLSEGLPGVVGSLSSRSEAQVMRLALILSLLNKRTQIEVEALKAALAIHQYSLDTLYYIFGKKTGIPLADKLYDFIAAAEKAVSKTEIRDFLNRNQTRETVDDALNLLLESKLINTIDIPNGGRVYRGYVVSADNSTINDFYDQDGDMSLMSSSVRLHE